MKLEALITHLSAQMPPSQEVISVESLLPAIVQGLEQPIQGATANLCIGRHICPCTKAARQSSLAYGFDCMYTHQQRSAVVTARKFSLA